MTSTTRPGTWQGLRPLVWPIYVPSLIYAAGAAAVAPAQVLLALQLGFSPAAVAGLATWIGGFAIFSSFISGYLVAWLGDHRSVIVVTGVGTAGLLAAWAATAAHVPGAVWVLVAALTMFDLVDAVWSVARQGLVADLAPAHLRGRASNLYGASQRAGRVLGPLLAAGVLAWTGPAQVLPVAVAVVWVAAGIYSRFSPARHQDLAAAAAAAGPEPSSGRRRAMTALVLLGVGIVILTALRTAKESLIPLWASQGVGAPDPQVALVMSATSVMELALFWPAGVALDRWGRAPVVVTALALMSVGLLLMPLRSDVWWLVATAALVGLGDGVGAGIVKTLGIDVAPRQQRGRFLGWWQSVASVGSFAAPALASAIIAAWSLRVAVVSVGAVGVVGAGWMAWWTPRIVPRAPQPPESEAAG